MGEPAPATPPATPAPAPATPPADNTLTGQPPATDPKLTNVPPHPVKPNEELTFDARLYTEDGKFNKDGAKEFFEERKQEKEKYEKRILDLRRKVSDGKAPETKDEYFQDFAPADEKYMKYFDPKAPSAEDVKGITDLMAETYHASALTRRQADDVTNSMMKVLEKVGVVDTRTDEQRYIAQQKWITDQKKQLGSNADNIIREARVFVENAPVFSAETKNKLIELMEKLGAPFIDTIHQLKESYGGATGGVPSSIANLGGLPSDAELKAEYLNPATQDFRRQEIINLRAKAGRTGRLMDA